MKMKKYLMSGIAAIAVCAAFTSCSKENLYNEDQINQNAIAKAQQDYAAAFIATFGQPAANQDWGFGSRAFTRVENANANEWADPNKAYGGLLVPPPLTDEQIAVVREYFQTHDKLGYEDPKWSNYFIQQVYKGHTNVPEGCPTPEQYLSANGSSYIIASDHMDHLIAVDKEKGIEDHINNFNHGDCSTNGTVLDNGGNANDGPFHSDKIMYMMNSTTKSFGYHNSDGSLYHTEYTGLVSYKTIMQAMGTKANCLDDGWNRSFMGFDFEQMVGEDVYAARRDYVNRSEENNWQGELVITYESYHYFTFEGKQYHYLDADRNMYAADLTEESYKQKNGSNSTIGGVADFSNVPSDDIIRDLLSKDYLPVIGSADKVWVKVGGTADGYFSDWIVTLTEAKIPTPSEYDIRVIAEDLNANADDDARTDEDSDWDFNDVVFDIKFLDENELVDGKNVKIRVVAAGGTYPLYIENQEVHALFGQDTDVMINTEAARYGKHYDTSTLPEIYLYSATAKQSNGKDIHIYVDKGNGKIELTAEVGLPAAKLGVSPNFNFCKERVDITSQYPLFMQWVRTATPQAWWNSNITGN